MTIKRQVTSRETSRKWRSNTIPGSSKVMEAMGHSTTMMKQMTSRIMERTYRTVVNRSIYWSGIIMQLLAHPLNKISKKGQRRLWIHNQWIDDQKQTKSRVIWERASTCRTNLPNWFRFLMKVATLSSCKTINCPALFMADFRIIIQYWAKVNSAPSREVSYSTMVVDQLLKPLALIPAPSAFRMVWAQIASYIWSQSTAALVQSKG